MPLFPVYVCMIHELALAKCNFWQLSGLAIFCTLFFFFLRPETPLTPFFANDFYCFFKAALQKSPSSEILPHTTILHYGNELIVIKFLWGSQYFWKKIWDLHIFFNLFNGPAKRTLLPWINNQETGLTEVKKAGSRLTMQILRLHSWPTDQNL